MIIFITPNLRTINMQGTKSATKRFRNKVENQLRIPSMAKSLLGSNHFRIHFKGTVLIVYTHETFVVFGSLCILYKRCT